MQKAPPELAAKMMQAKLGPSAGANSAQFEQFKPEKEERRVNMDSNLSQETPYSNNKPSAEQIINSLEDLKVLDLKAVHDKSKEILKEYKKQLGALR